MTQIRSEGLIVARREDGTLSANVQHVVYHSPTGFECGYAGSGPADLALSALAAWLPVDAEDPLRREITLGEHKGVVSWAAWQLHQDFKTQFLVTMPPDGGVVSATEIEDFVTTRLLQCLCDHCRTFFQVYDCNAPEECDCPRCQGLCCCPNAA